MNSNPVGIDLSRVFVTGSSAPRARKEFPQASALRLGNPPHTSLMGFDACRMALFESFSCGRRKQRYYSLRKIKSLEYFSGNLISSPTCINADPE